MQLLQAAGDQVPRQQAPAVVRLGVRSRDHAGTAGGWDGEPSYGGAFRLVVDGSGFGWGERRAGVI